MSNIDKVFTETAEAVIRGERVILDGKVQRIDPKRLRDMYTVRLARIIGLASAWRKVEDLTRALLSLEESIQGIR